MPRRRFAHAVALGMAVASVAGCNVGGLQGLSTTTTEVVRPRTLSPRPEVGECRGLVTREIIQAPSDVRRPVSCDEPHGSETVFVGDLPAEVSELSHRDAAALAIDSSPLRPLVEECDAEFELYVGVSRVGPDAVRESNLTRAFFLPDFDDWSQGARWFRCDAVTEPLNGLVTRGVTQRLRGILDRDFLPPELRPCYRDVSAPPRLAFSFFASCDQPHAAEALLRYQVTDPKVDAVAADRAQLEELARREFIQPCTERVAALLGMSTESLAARPDITVSSLALQISRWPADPKARWVQCIAFTPRLTVGTLEGLGDRPLPLP